MSHIASARSATGTDLRHAILDATRQLLVADGYPNLSMRKIAGAVGCSATSIYLHFAGKDALVHALIGEGMETLHDALTAADFLGLPPNVVVTCAEMITELELELCWLGKDAALKARLQAFPRGSSAAGQ